MDDADKSSFAVLSNRMRKLNGKLGDAGAQGRAKMLMDSGVGEEGIAFLEQFVASGGSLDQGLAVLSQGQAAGLAPAMFGKLLSASTSAATSPAKTTTLADGTKIKRGAVNANPIDVFMGALTGGGLPSGVELPEGLGPKLAAFRAQGNLSAGAAAIAQRADGLMALQAEQAMASPYFKASEEIEAARARATERQRSRANAGSEVAYERDLEQLRSMGPVGSVFADSFYSGPLGRLGNWANREGASGAGQTGLTSNRRADAARVTSPAGGPNVNVTVDYGGDYSSSNGI